MTHEEYQAIIPAYAFGAADEPEARLLARHLRRCRQCGALLASYRALSENLLYAIIPASAPAGLSGRLLRGLVYPTQMEGSFGQARDGVWRGVRPILAWPVIMLALLSLLLTNVYWFDRVRRLEAQMTGQTVFGDSVPTTPAAVLRSDPGGDGAQGVVYTGTRGKSALVCVFEMPELPAGMAYQVWLIEDGKRDSGGLFHVSPDGYGILQLDLKRPLADYEALGITVEPEEGSTGPTSPRVIGGPL
jgi:hypothetical protein